jgi:hypothetical protein
VIEVNLLSQCRLSTWLNVCVGFVNFVTGMTGGILLTLAIGQALKRVEQGMFVTPELVMTGILMLMGCLMIVNGIKLLNMIIRHRGDTVKAELGTANKAAQSVSLAFITLMLLSGGQALNAPMIVLTFVFMGVGIWMVGTIVGYTYFKAYDVERSQCIRLQ